MKFQSLPTPQKIYCDTLNSSSYVHASFASTQCYITKYVAGPEKAENRYGWQWLVYSSISPWLVRYIADQIFFYVYKNGDG